MRFRSAAPLVCGLLLCAAPVIAQQPTAAPAEDLYAQIPALGDSGERKLQKGDARGAIDDFKQAFEASRALTRQYPDEPAYRENAYFYLGRLATALGSVNDVKAALQMAEPSARGYAQIAAADPTPENTQKATEALGRLAWFQVLNNDAAAAEASARQALALSPDEPFVKLNLAHALLLNGNRDEARAIYTALQNEPAGEGRTIRDVILDDFNAMRKAGLPNETISPMRAEFGGANENILPAVLIISIFAFVALLTIVIIYVDRKRTAALEAKVKSLGFAFRRKPTEEDKQLTAGSVLATVGRNREIRNVIELPAAQGARMTIFDFSYVVGSGKQSHTYRQTVARIQSPKLNLPGFELRPESMLSKIAQSFGGMKDIDIEGWPNFSRRYLLRGSDDEAIRRMFTPDLLQYCEANRGLWISGAGDTLWFHREGRRAKPAELANFIDDAQQAFTLFAAAAPAAETSPPLSSA